MRVTIGGLLDRAQIDYREEGTTGDLAVSWWFGRMFRDMALKSIHWAILDRQTAFAMTSKYSVLLFQYFASLQNLKHKTDEVFSVPQIRAILGVPKGRLKTAVLHQSPDKRGVPLPVKMVSQLTQTWHSQVRSFC